ncbi:MAG: flagellar hook-basal body complex protein [Legionella sp.]
MSSTYYTSLSGMMVASYGLQNTSNNVANMQSPGFKRSDVFYSSLGNGSGEEGLGCGVKVSGSSTNFTDGKYLETNNPSDLAIIGQGFFVVRMKTGELLYTRAGEFAFNNDGVLIDRRSGGEVQGYNSAGNLVAIHEKGPKTSAGKASRELFLNGQFVLLEQTEDEKKGQIGNLKNKYKNIKFEVAKVYDDQGKEHLLQLEFRSTPVIVNDGSINIPDDGTSWDLVGVTCDGQEVPFDEQNIIFSNVGSGPGSSNNSIKLTLNNGQPLFIKLGTYVDGANSVQLKETKYNSEGTKIELFQNDGYGLGKQISFTFDEHGQISYNYDNGQSITGIHVGLARFDDLAHSLVSTQNNLFRAKNDDGRHIGRANKDGFGSIKSKQVESSNVDSTTEFANIVILQRMFQACSQIMDIDKQLLEELKSK